MTELWLIRHGETAWSASGKHTSVTDLALTERGEQRATAIASRLEGVEFDQVLTSPLRRAHDTATLAGFTDAEVDPDLFEWRYGDYEGLTTPEIRETVPGWTVWSHPSPGGETPAQVSERVDRVVGRAAAIDRRTLAFAHGHSLRAVAARWLGLPVTDGRLFDLDTATISVLGFYRETAVVQRWNS